jgi:hypothetical protein
MKKFKKFICLFLPLVLMLSGLSGCNDKSENTTASMIEPSTESTTDKPSAKSKTDKPSVWNGSVATSFADGNGTESNPYQIATAPQFALLAKNVNEGTTYSGKYFSLLCDINLNHIDWTPIGNGIHAFMGNFDGKGHTVENLKISQSIHYTYEYPTGRKAAYCDSGLFATVQDASIQNMIIDGATIKISDTKSGDTHRVGVLCGTVRTYQSASVISNIAIKNATITADFSTNQHPEWLSVGGAIGHVYAYNNTTTTISLVETNSALSLEKGYGSSNYMGTILGSSSFSDSTFNMENCAAYQTLSVSPEQYYYTFTNDFCGAIGNAQASAKPFTVKNVFSKSTLNKPALESAMTAPSAIASHVIIGEAYYFALKDDPNAIGYKFENVFGCVEHVDTKTGEKKILTNLYVLPQGPTFSQTNCHGCEALPENHGFDATTWDLSDLAKPKLK